MDDARTAGQASAPSHELIVDPRYTEGAYFEANDDWHEGDAAWKAAQVAEMLARHDLAPQSVCDIGCGTGGVLAELRQLLPNSPSLVGYEVSDRALALGADSRHDAIELVHGSHEADDRRFDLLLCLDVVEHIEDYYGFLRSIRTKADRAVFHIPIDTAVTSVLRPAPLLRSAQKVGHIQHFTRTSALAALEHAGYTVEGACHTVPAAVAEPRSSRQRVGRTARLAGARMSVDLAARFMTGFPLLVLART